MGKIIDLTVSPSPEVIEISSEPESTPPGSRGRTQENKKQKRKKGKTPNGGRANYASGSSAQPSRAHSPETRNDHGELNKPASPPRPASNLESTTDQPGLFIFDGAAAPIVAKNGSPTPEPVESDGDGAKLLLPAHVAILHDNGHTPAKMILPPEPSSDNEEYIEYLDYEDRKAPGLVRYFEVSGDESNRSKPSISKCKNCGVEGDHKTYDCPVQICLTCGARDEHSTRSCPISKTCYTCGMKGHINKTCPNRFSAHMASSDFNGDCDRCGSTEHKMNECPTLWRIYQYVNDEERLLIMQSRGEREQLSIGEGGEGYVGEEVWCYNCADTGHLGDDCNELPRPATFPTEHSAFGFHNVMSGPFFDPAAETISVKRGQRERKGNAGSPRLTDGWNADVPVDVGKRGKSKDKERLEKRFREREDEDEDWFNDIQNVKRRGMDQQTRPPDRRGKTMKLGQFQHSSSRPPSLPSSGLSLLARLSDRQEGKNDDQGRNRHESSHHSIHIRGAAADPRSPEGKYLSKPDSERGQDQRDGNKPGPGRRGSKHGHGPRYKGGYDR